MNLEEIFTEEEREEIGKIILKIKYAKKKKYKWEEEIEKISWWQIESLNLNRFIPNKRPELRYEAKSDERYLIKP